MVEQLRRDARDFRKNGYPDWAALIENVASLAEKAGVPKVFSPGTTGGLLEMQGEISGLRDGKEIRKRLIDVLSLATIEQGSPLLTPGLARKINLQVGQYLSDETSTQDLILPSIRIEKRVERLNNTALLGVYNRALRVLYRAKYSTIGSIRDTDPSILKKGRNIGYGTIAFVKTAFARRQVDKQ